MSQGTNLSGEDRDNPYAPPRAVPPPELAAPEAEAPHSVGWARYLVLAALCLAAILVYMQRNSLGVAEAAMREELGLSKEVMGAVMSAFFFSYALFQLPTGWGAKIFGTRVALPLFVTLSSAATGVFAIASGFPLLLTGRLGMGAFQSGVFPCAVASISKWMPTSQRSFATGMLGGCMSLGGALGGTLMGLLLPFAGWRISIALFALPAFLFAAAFLFLFRDDPAGAASANAAIDPTRFASRALEPTPWGRILTSLPVWALCGQHVFRAAGYIFFASWFTTFLRETRGVADLEAGLLTGLPLIAVMVGSPLGGVLSDFILARTGSRRLSRQGLAVASMLSCAALVVLAYPIQNAWLAVLVISLGSFCAAFSGPCAYTASIDIGGRHTAMVFSLMNMLGNVGAFLFPLAVPYLLAEGNTPGSGNWTLVLFTFAGVYVAAAICWLLADVRASVAPDESP